MGARGPAPLPTKIKLLHGEKRPARLNLNEPQPANRAPVMPPDMKPEAQVVWHRILRDYGAASVITAIDADSFRIYCDAVARYERAAKALDDSGLLVRSSHSGEFVKNPLHQIVRDNAVLVRALAREFGLTPSARSGLTVEEGGDELDQWAKATG